ncbi:MAG: hypothetical protein M1830_002142 [Pleopsidium flavum]|nr:MAG: hypothetical protein M1830_002142 [Pleopsidium flavum]
MTSPFFRIPVEIRDRIYKLVLTSTKPIRVVKQNRQQLCRSALRSGRALRPTEEQDDRKVLEGRSRLAILFTCRQIYNEAVPNYYRENTFVIDNVKILDDFITTIGDACRSEVRSIIYCSMSKASAKLLPKLTGLRRLELRLTTHPVDRSLRDVCQSLESLVTFKLRRSYCRYDSDLESELSINLFLSKRRQT